MSHPTRTPQKCRFKVLTDEELELKKKNYKTKILRMQTRELKVHLENSLKMLDANPLNFGSLKRQM